MAFVSSVSATVHGAAKAQRNSAVCERKTTLRGTPLPTSRATLPVGESVYVDKRRNVTSMKWGETFSESLTRRGDFTVFLELASACSIDLDALEGTLFAPNNAAFGRLKPGTLEAWYRKLDVAKAILVHHIVPQKMTLAQISGVGFWENTQGGPMSYEGLGGVIKVGGSIVVQDSSNDEVTNGIIHVVESILTPAGVTRASIAQGYVPSIAAVGDTVVSSLYPSAATSVDTIRAAEAAGLPSTTGGRKAMGLVKQLPFWMYGPPFNAAPQEDYEPISIAEPEGAEIDYQIFAPGTVVVTPDSVNANELNPVSGMSRYIGKTKKQVEGAGMSDYSRLNQTS